MASDLVGDFQWVFYGRTVMVFHSQRGVFPISTWTGEKLPGYHWRGFGGVNCLSWEVQGGLSE